MRWSIFFIEHKRGAGVNNNQEYILMKYSRANNEWRPPLSNLSSIPSFSLAKNLICYLLSNASQVIDISNQDIKLHRCDYCNIKKQPTSARWVCIDQRCCQSDIPFELCHKDFVNLKDQPHLVHQLDHKMVWLKYNPNSQSWETTNKFCSQSEFTMKDSKCSVWHTSLKKQKMKIEWEEWRSEQTGLFTSYWADHVKLKCSGHRTKKYKWAVDYWEPISRYELTPGWHLWKSSKANSDKPMVFLR